MCKKLNLQGNGVEIARKGKFEKRPHNFHPRECARNGIIQKSNNWELQRTEFARK